MFRLLRNSPLNRSSGHYTNKLRLVIPLVREMNELHSDGQ